MFTDTHCHLELENLDNVIKKANLNGINKLINNGCDKKSNNAVLSISKKHKNVYAAIGFHPQNLENWNDDNLKQIEENIDDIVAIGEIGLDYLNGDIDHELQKNVFIKQIELANKYNKPIIVHSRNATLDTEEILKKHCKVKGVIHCFSGSLETAKIYIKLGFKLGVGGVLTFKNSNLPLVISQISINDIVFETDAPYLAPEPVRGNRNEPANIIYIAQKVAEIKNVSLNYLSLITEENVSAIFDI